METGRQEDDALSSLSTENYRILENIALNDENTLPWPDLRRVIRQRLSQTVEILQAQSSTDQEDANESFIQHTTEAEITSAIESSRKRSKSEASVETNGIVKISGKNEDTTTADDSTPSPPENDQRESTLEVEEQPRQREEDKENALDVDAAIAQREAPKDVLEAAEGDDTLSREIRDLEDRINYCLQSFDDAPFTIQRIAELLVWPERHYRGAMKFLRAVERVVYVTSTVEDFPPTSSQTNDPTDSPNDEVEGGMDSASVAIEGEGESSGGVIAPPSSLFSFLASQDTHGSAATGIISGESSNDVGSIGTKAIAAKEHRVLDES